MADAIGGYDQPTEIGSYTPGTGDRVPAGAPLAPNSGDDRFNHSPPERSDDIVRRAMSSQSAGMLAEAEQLFIQALAAVEHESGADALALIPVLTMLGNTLSARSAHQEGEHLLTRALAIGERQLGAEHPDLIVLLNDLSRLYLKQGSYERAEPLLQRLLTFKRKKGDEHPEVATVLASLATVRQGLGDHDAAEQLHRRVLQIREKTLAPNHFGVATALEHLADACAARGKVGEALRHYQRALMVREHTLGAGHASLRTSRERIADLQLQASEESHEVMATLPPPVATPSISLQSTIASPRFGGTESARPALPPREQQAAPVPMVAVPTREPQRAPAPVAAIPPREAQRAPAPVAAIPPRAPEPAPAPVVAVPPRAPQPAPAPVLAVPPREPQRAPAPVAFVAPQEPARTPDVAPAAVHVAPQPSPDLADVAVPARMPDAWELHQELQMRIQEATEEPLVGMSESFKAALAKPMVRNAAIGVGVVALLVIAIAGYQRTTKAGEPTSTGTFTASTSAASGLTADPRSAGAYVANTSSGSLDTRRSPDGAARADLVRPAGARVSEETGAQRGGAESLELGSMSRPAAPNVATVNSDSVIRATSSSAAASQISKQLLASGSDATPAASAFDPTTAGTSARLQGALPRPTYPEYLRQLGVKGEVLVQFEVDERGAPNLSTLQIVRSPHELLTTEVRKVINRLHFDPSRTGGANSKPRTERVQISFVFDESSK